MDPGLVRPYTSFPLVRIAVLAALTLFLAGWSTCSAMFLSCETSVPQPQITALSPSAISVDMESVPLKVKGSGFAPQSQILWNGNPLPTTFIDSGHLQAVITQQTLTMFGGASGSAVSISVQTQDLNPVAGCPIGASSAILILAIN